MSETVTVEVELKLTCLVRIDRDSSGNPLTQVIDVAEFDDAPLNVLNVSTFERLNTLAGEIALSQLP